MSMLQNPRWSLSNYERALIGQARHFYIIGYFTFDDLLMEFRYIKDSR